MTAAARSGAPMPAAYAATFAAGAASDPTDEPASPERTSGVGLSKADAG